MFINNSEKKLIKIWLPDEASVEPACMIQAKNLANLPFAFRHIVLMPDTHKGYGMPVGGILATQDVIVPNAVGVDIGCGMVYVHTNVPVQTLKEWKTGNGNMVQKLVGEIMRSIPTGTGGRRQTPLPFNLEVDVAKDRLELTYFNSSETSPTNDALWDKIFPEANKQLGTLGSGNHFIELQEDQNGMLAIMLHSGSRNVGYSICGVYNKKAIALNTQWFSSVPTEWELAFLPLDTKEGKEYIAWMDFAQKFAMQNREEMMKIVKDILVKNLWTDTLEVRFDNEVNAHHNYAAIENHFGENVWVHRKGAIRMREGEYGIIPGAMGSNSYIVMGKGNPETFQSCSHGAGRAMSRTAAKKAVTAQSVIEDLKAQDIVIGKHKMDDVAEECRQAYKDIEVVMENQKDLVDIVTKLKTVAVIKG